jgi:hypothetical protein
VLKNLIAKNKCSIVSQIVTRRYSVIASITRKFDNETWALTVVYGPQSESDKLCFMQELKAIQQTFQDRWMLLGDFNLICRASDKSGGRINRRLLNAFRQLLNDIEMKEIHLHGRCYTWTSGTQTPKLIKC